VEEEEGAFGSRTVLTTNFSGVIGVAPGRLNLAKKLIERGQVVMDPLPCRIYRTVTRCIVSYGNFFFFFDFRPDGKEKKILKGKKKRYLSQGVGWGSQ
jgi:hypothetical protein